MFFKLWHGELKVVFKGLYVSIYVPCRTVLSEADTNKDGKISLDELTAWTQKALRAIHKRETKDRLENLDTNKDGLISWEEFQMSKENIGGTNGSSPLSGGSRGGARAPGSPSPPYYE